MKKLFLRQEMDLCKVTMKYGRVVVFIRHDSAEIWGVRYCGSAY
jgi:formylmethanofuran dehydrogenase subunit D